MTNVIARVEGVTPFCGESRRVSVTDVVESTLPLLSGRRQTYDLGETAKGNQDRNMNQSGKLAHFPFVSAIYASCSPST